ncbi:hypothetical protein NW806_10765 [Synechococcus sp. W65.1]|uniref:hypothetical protein n=1 Tax=Synechococcus sp. W65.1 TaxID=2964526 RepID=UPI0039C3B372
MKRLKEQFAELGYCHIPQFVPPVLLNEWADDLHWLVATQLKRFGLAASEESDPVRRLSRSLNRSLESQARGAVLDLRGGQSAALDV